MTPLDRLPWVTYYDVGDECGEALGQAMYDLLCEVTTVALSADGESVYLSGLVVAPEP